MTKAQRASTSEQLGSLRTLLQLTSNEINQATFLNAEKRELLAPLSQITTKEEYCTPNPWFSRSILAIV